jgi:hypothetical protein
MGHLVSTGTPCGCGQTGGKRPGRTPLHVAAEKRNLDVAKELLKRGANVNACDVRYRNLLAGSDASFEWIVLVLICGCS